MPEGGSCTNLYSLIPWPRANFLKTMVGLGRFELPTHGLGNRCSIHLSYRPVNNLRFYGCTLVAYSQSVDPPFQSGFELPHGCGGSRTHRFDVDLLGCH